jgi:hypothetical protein
MKEAKIKDIRPIEGFKVMEWVRNVRESRYNLYKNDPDEYYRRLKKAGERAKARINKASKA